MASRLPAHRRWLCVSDLLGWVEPAALARPALHARPAPDIRAAEPAERPRETGSAHQHGDASAREAEPCGDVSGDYKLRLRRRLRLWQNDASTSSPVSAQLSAPRRPLHHAARPAARLLALLGGLASGWWGSGLGDGWPFALAAVTAAGMIATAAGIALRRRLGRRPRMGRKRALSSGQRSRAPERQKHERKHRAWAAKKLLAPRANALQTREGRQYSCRSSGRRGS
jgi:hypothetical protein